MTDPQRHVIRITGEDRVHFLQGLVSSDVTKLDQGLVYTALLTPQGKYLADFFLVPENQGILIDCAAPLAAGLMQRLSMYRLRSDVALTDTDIVVTRGLGPCPEGAFQDPRHPEMGWRGYAGQPGDATDWTAQRVALGIPESGIELTPDTYLLEAGFERLHGVDFRKGCYVGQEVTARMKHKTELKKGLARVAIAGTAPVGTDIVANGKVVGTLYSQAHGQALAHLRFDRATGPMTAESATVTWDGQSL